MSKLTVIARNMDFSSSARTLRAHVRTIVGRCHLRISVHPARISSETHGGLRGPDRAECGPEITVEMSLSCFDIACSLAPMTITVRARISEPPRQERRDGRNNL
jgi:hypothetical protein